MKKTETRTNMSRRDFLKWGAAGIAAAAGGYVLYEYAPWLSYTNQADQTWFMDNPAEGSANPFYAMVHSATLAANGHNTQPWTFHLTDAGIDIVPDFSRRLAVVDPNDRELWISLGCALENLLLAAQAGGFTAAVNYPDSTETISVQLTAGDKYASPLYQAISTRQNTRSEYDGRLIPNDQYDAIQALLLEPGVMLKTAPTPEDMKVLDEYVREGNRIQYGDPAFLDELIFWLRFNKKEALKTMDGLYSRCSGNPEVPRWLGKSFVQGTKPEQQADADSKKLMSSGGAVVISTEQDAPSAWVRAGQVYQRLALQLTVFGVKSAFLNQPIEVVSLRSQFQSAFGLGSALPQLLMRYGYADALPRSLRRPVTEVIKA